VTLIVGSFAKIGKQLEGFYDVMASMDKLGHLFDMPLERLDGIECPRLDEGMTVGIHDLSLQASLTGHQIQRASFLITAGEKCVLIGKPAESRSLLLEAMAGFRAPVSGHVELDGNDVRRLRLDSVRDQVVLLRDVEVFSGSVAENLHVGRGEVSEDDLRSALQATDLLDLVLDLPQGLETIVQTEGAQFSNDQLVQLMLARALAGHPRLLLIDGLLDRLSDEALCRTLPGMLSLGSATTILVATGRSDVAAYFDRHWSLTSDGPLKELYLAAVN
jgi:ABC-type multidrug transport system fused ATPase/permease subunit